MRKQYAKHNIFLAIYFSIIALWVAAILTKAYRAPGDQILRHEGSYFDCSEGWYDDDGNPVNIETIKFQKSELSKTYNFHYRLPQNYNFREGEAICFYSRAMDFEVYVMEGDGTEKRKIYDFKQNAAKLSGSDIGLCLQHVAICKEDKNNEIIFSITPADTAAFILAPRIQKISDFILHAIRSRLPRFIASLFIFFFGFATIVYTMFAMKTEREHKTVFYAWGSFSLIMGILLIIQSQVLQILTGRPEFYNTLKYALALLMGFPMAVQSDSLVKAPHKRFSPYVGAVVMVLILFAAIGNFFKNISLYKLFYISALIMLYVKVMTIYYLFKEIKYCKKNNKPFTSVFMLSLMIALTFVAITDLLTYAKAGRRLTDWGRYIRLSYIIFIFIMLILALRESIRRNRQASLAEKYKTDSLTDAMTGLMNKGAYIARENELSQKLWENKSRGKLDYSFVIMSLDLNYLKKVNDTLGHNVGDNFIISAAQILKDSIANNGEIYRVGGDEFLVLVFGDEPEQTYKEITQKLDNQIKAFNDNHKHEIPLTFAYGHSLCTSGQDYSFHDSERLADKEMYECKRNMKAER